MLKNSEPNLHKVFKYKTDFFKKTATQKQYLGKMSYKTGKFLTKYYIYKTFTKASSH